MKYLMTFIWAVLLLEMVNFVLNSLNSGPALNVINPIIMAVVFTIFIAILGAYETKQRFRSIRFIVIFIKDEIR